VRPKWPIPVAPSSTKLPTEPTEAGFKPVEAAFFFPQGKIDELAKVKERFREVIKKHKLKFRLESIFEQPYEHTNKVNCAFFTERCWANNALIAIVLGPPAAEGRCSPEEFTGLITTAMDDGKISLQLIPWAELNKDYRYLNLALDITLLKHQG
jgi:hypothetical protein